MPWHPPLVMASGLALGAVPQRADAPVGIIALWALALLSSGPASGSFWPHLTVRAMDSVADPAESSAAAAACRAARSRCFRRRRLAECGVNTAGRRSGGGSWAIHGIYGAAAFSVIALPARPRTATPR